MMAMITMTTRIDTFLFEVLKICNDDDEGVGQMAILRMILMMVRRVMTALS